MNRMMAGTFAAILAVTSAPALARSPSPAALGTIFCTGVLTHEMADAMAWMTPDLAAKVAAITGEKGAGAIRWASTPGADRCMPVGSAGSAEVPVAILYYTWSDRSHAGFSDQLVTRFVNEELRIDDVVFPDGRTLRQQLGEN
jgi:hypothetical protein